MKLSRLLFVLGAVAGFLLFLYRGPIRALHRGGGGDFATVYVADHRLAIGQDPYACCGTFGSEWIAAGGPKNVVPDMSGQHPAYPPMTLIILMPFSFLRWIPALWLEVILGTLGLILVIATCARLLSSEVTTNRKLLFVALALSLSPLHTGIAVANVGILAFVLAAFALFAASRAEVVGGFLLTLSICLKPTVAAPLLVFFLVTKRWRLVLSCGSCCALLLVWSAVRFSELAPTWRSQYRENIAYLFSPIGDASFVPRYADMLNLQNPLYAALQNVNAAKLGAWIITGFLFVFWLRYGRSVANMQMLFASVSCLWLIGLLPVYQRSYNAGALIFVLVWSVLTIEKLEAKLVLYLIPLFMIPGFTIFYLHSITSNSFPIEHSEIYKALVLCHQTWAIVLIILLQLRYLRRHKDEDVKRCVLRPSLLRSPLIL